MIQFYAQLDYLRNVQRNFGSGSERLDLVGVFGQILLVVLPIILLMAFWYYRHLVLFGMVRFFSRLLSPKSGKVIEDYIVTKGVMLDIYFYSAQGVGRKLCNARVKSVTGGKMELLLSNVSPTSLNLKNQRVICFTKPFAYSGQKINAFITFVSHMKKRGTVIKELSLLTPVRYRFMIRRRHTRQRVAKEGAVRVKAWAGSKRSVFWMAKPDLQTINNPAHYGTLTRLAVENISPGGMRMLVVHPKGELPPLKVDSQLVLRVSVWSQKTRKFSYFNVIGTIRSRFKGKGGAIGLGIQFTAEASKVGNQYTWKSLHGELEALAQFLDASS